MSERKNDEEFCKVTRRKFLRDAGFVIGGTAISASLLAACGKEEVTKTVQVPITVEKTVTVTPTTPAGPKLYTATARGMGELSVTTGILANKIVSVVVEGPHETPGIGSMAIDQLPARIVGANSVNVDGVTGATYTSNAIFSAVRSCLAEAGISVEPPTFAPQHYIAGVYTASSKGHGGPINVEVELSENKILSVKASGELETPSLIQGAREVICPAIVEHQSLAVDTVSTATFSSRGILRAVADCIDQAGGNSTELKKVPVPVPAKGPDETISTDVVVVGGGTSGSVALYTLAHEGINAVCIESAHMVGGAGEIAGFASMGWVNSNLQKASFDPIDMPAFLEQKSNSYAEMCNYFLDARLVKRHLEDCGPMVDLLLDSGMEITATSATACRIPGKGLRWKILHTAAEQLGAKTYVDTRAKELILDSNGKISAVKATRKDGSTLTVNTKAVIMCTGGASANPAMMQQYFPNYTEYGENCGISTTDGKGLQMCWDVGAAKGLFGLHAHNHTMPLSAKYAGVDTVLGLDDISTMGNVPLLWLNLEGERIGKETWAWSPTPGGNIVAYGKRLFNVFDQATVDHCVQNGSPVRAWRGKRDQPLPDLQQQLAEGTALGYVFKGNTIAELSAKIGWNPDVAAEQIARYNQMVENQLDTDHYKQVEALVFKVETAPFYAIEIRPRYLGTFGGLIVSKDYEVLKENDHPIPGLYAAGDNASGWYGRLYPNIGGLTSQHNTTSGYTASLSAIEYIRG